MLNFENWCELWHEEVEDHVLSLIVATDTQAGVELTAISVPEHYCHPARLANLLENHGYTALAAAIAEKLPTALTIRSGDLAEIVATEYVSECSDYTVPVKRLRWKDHRNMSMRGDDLLGFFFDAENEQLLFLKAEVKSRQSLSSAAIDEARQGLDGFDQRPSPHSLMFIADRLFESGDEELSDLITKSVLTDTISLEQIEHLLFSMSGSHPERLLRKGLTRYQGDVPQWYAGLKVEDHKGFIDSVFGEVLNNGD